jgi:glucosyl-dolichyl phosphate glucuronosyltransferase
MKYRKCPMIDRSTLIKSFDDALPKVSVVICTHNRSFHLRTAIQSVVEQSISHDFYEILVIDNCSDDETREVVDSFQSAGNVRYLYEPNLGLCHARNRGWEHAEGQYVAYLDDDAVASPGWIEAIINAFHQYPNAGAVGGRVDPVWEADRPEWLSDQLSLGLTILDWASAPMVLPNLNGYWLVGANLAMPRSLLRDVGGFHTALDRVGKRMLSSGDVFLTKMIKQRGYDCIYYPDMAVSHLVPADRLKKSWFRNRYYWQGVSDVVMQLIEEDLTAFVRIKQAFRKFVNLFSSPRQISRLVVPTNDPSLFTIKCFAWVTVGQIAGLLGRARR